MYYYNYRNRNSKKKKILIALIFVVLAAAIAACAIVISGKNKNKKAGKPQTTQTPAATEEPEPTPVPSPIIEEANTVGTRFTVPADCERTVVSEGSFGEYLRNYTLKSYGTVPKYADGTDNENVPTVGILELDVRKNNLQRNAGTIIRLYAEYRYAREEYDRISFNFFTTPPFECGFSTWITGQRIKVDGSKVEWYKSSDATPGDTSYNTFRYYLDNVMTYANVESLRLELSKVEIDKIAVGDCLIVSGSETQSGSGHALLIVDMAVNKKTGKKTFICAEGDSSKSCEPYILTDADGGVWLSFDENDSLTIDGRTYTAASVRRFS